MQCGVFVLGLRYSARVIDARGARGKVRWVCWPALALMRYIGVGQLAAFLVGDDYDDDYGRTQTETSWIMMIITEKLMVFGWLLYYIAGEESLLDTEANTKRMEWMVLCRAKGMCHNHTYV